MFLILIGIIFLCFGAESLVRGSSRLAEKFGIPPLIIGLTVVAFGTSSPELLVSISAALKGSSDVAMGNVVGSNIFNIAVILGLTALIRPPRVHLDLIRREIPIMLVVTVVASVLVLWGAVPRLAGMALFAGLCAYLVFSIRMAGRQNNLGEFKLPETRAIPVWACCLLILAGLGILAFGSHLFVTGAVKTARQFGLSEAVIGLTIVAAGTSLPELATSLVAAIKRESDVAIGNIVGSNIFNILGILGLTASILPLEVSGVGVVDAGFMLGISLLLLPFAFSQKLISRWEGGVFLCIYLFYLYLLWPKN